MVSRSDDNYNLAPPPPPPPSGKDKAKAKAKDTAVIVQPVSTEETPKGLLAIFKKDWTENASEGARVTYMAASFVGMVAIYPAIWVGIGLVPMLTVAGAMLAIGAAVFAANQIRNRKKPDYKQNPLMHFGMWLFAPAYAAALPVFLAYVGVEKLGGLFKKNTKPQTPKKPKP